MFYPKRAKYNGAIIFTNTFKVTALKLIPALASL